MAPLLDSMWLKTSGYVVADCRYHCVSRAGSPKKYPPKNPLENHQTTATEKQVSPSTPVHAPTKTPTYNHMQPITALLGTRPSLACPCHLCVCSLPSRCLVVVPSWCSISKTTLELWTASSSSFLANLAQVPLGVPVALLFGFLQRHPSFPQSLGKSMRPCDESSVRPRKNYV
jgi:hypothetical protein